MPWTWRYQSTAEQAPEASQAFPTQSDAETWIGEVWQELLESGIDAVFLFEDDHQVYGPMSLHPAE